MNLHKELVSANSPAWIGIQHFLWFIFYLYIFSSVSSIIFFGTPYLYFNTPLDDIIIFGTGGFIATLVSFWHIKKKAWKSQKSGIVFVVSTACFILANLLMLYSLYFGDQTSHYGITGKDQIFETGVLFAISLFSYCFWGIVILRYGRRGALKK